MTAQTPQAQAAAAPRAAFTIYTPTPTQHENDLFATQQMHGTLPVPPPMWAHAMDGSPIDMQSKDPTAKNTSWP
jgi:hypothetical protein